MVLVSSKMWETETFHFIFFHFFHFYWPHAAPPSGWPCQISNFILNVLIKWRTPWEQEQACPFVEFYARMMGIPAAIFDAKSRISRPITKFFRSDSASYFCASILDVFSDVQTPVQVMRFRRSTAVTPSHTTAAVKRVTTSN